MVKEIQERTIEEIIQLEKKIFWLHMNSLTMSSLLTCLYVVLAIQAFCKGILIIGAIDTVFSLLFGYGIFESKNRLARFVDKVVRFQYKFLGD